MKTIGNILWLIIAGWETALMWLIAAVFCAITIVGFPFAIQCLKFARFSLWPFGSSVIHSPSAVPGGWIGNLLWFIPGLVLAATYLVSGIALCITIIGIPFGIQAFKFVPLAMFPFGKEVVSTRELRYRAAMASQIYGSF